MQPNAGDPSATRHRVGCLVAAGGLALTAACGAMDPTARVLRLDDPSSDLDLALPEITWTSDIWQVMICRVPTDSGDPIYVRDDVRLEASVGDIVHSIRPVSDYFARWSAGRYTLEFVPGPDLDITGTAQSCLDAGLDASDPEATGVVVIADAPHRDDRPGGWSQSGIGCARDTCPARQSRRGVYLGAADFLVLNQASAEVPLDLVEHEIGHAFGWPHSSRHSSRYDSVIDLMSDSAAPRRLSSLRRHGPGVLAFHRLSAGWLDPERVMVLGPGTARITLGSPGDRDRAEMAVIRLDRHRVLTIEVIADAGDNDHLVESGVAVHLIEWGPEVCADPGDYGLCTGVDRRVTVLMSADSVGELLAPGQSIGYGEVMVEVVDLVTHSSEIGRVVATVRVRQP
ncbi:MAG: hypothetical protein ACKOA6_09680 [Actinomycetota bacterium]